MAKRSSSVTLTISLSGSNTSGMRSGTSATFGRGWPGSVARLVEFGRFADLNRRQRGVGKPETFDFLGLTHYCTTTRRDAFGLVANRLPNGSTGPWRASTRCFASAGTTTSGKLVGGWGESAMAAQLLCRPRVRPVHPCVPPQAATPVDAGATPPVPASPI